MNISLLELAGKWLSIAFVSLVSFFDVNIYQEESMKVELSVKGEEEINVITPQISYPTIIENVESNIQNIQEVIPTGENIASEIVESVVDEEVESVSTVIYDEYVGNVTGYGPGCPGCSTVGNVACHTKDGGKHSLINDGIYYNDDTYGSVRILAAAKNKFPCGTIIEIIKDGYAPYTGVVLDRGSSMNSAWDNYQTIWIDLAYENNSLVSSDGLTGKNLKIVVKRWGW